MNLNMGYCELDGYHFDLKLWEVPLFSIAGTL